MLSAIFRVCCCLIVFCTVPSFAQSDSIVVSPKHSHRRNTDSTYIRKYPEYLAVAWNVAVPIMEIRLFPLQDATRRFYNYYKGNFTSSTGFSLGYKDVIVTLSFQASKNPKSTSKKGESSSLNYQARFHRNAIYFHGLYSRYTGFYDQNTLVNNNGQQVDSLRTVFIRPDIFYRQLMLTTTGNLTWKKYSFIGPRTFAERQIKSHAGILVRSTVGHMQLRGDSALVHGSQGRYFSSFNKIEKLNAFMIKMGPGVGANLVIFKRFYIATAFFVQANNVFYQYKSEDGIVTPILRSLAFFGEGNMGIGFNSQRFFMGVHASGTSNQVKLRDARLAVTVGTISLDMGYRFNCPRIIKKVWAKTMTRYFKL